MNRIASTSSQQDKATSALWRRVLDDGSDEYCSLHYVQGGAVIEGTIIGLTASHEPFLCNYRINANEALTASCSLVMEYRSQGSTQSLSVHRTEEGWESEPPRGTPFKAHEIDLEMSPLTNLFPIRKLLASSQSSLTMTAAWVRSPDLRLETALQRYDRIDDRTVRYTNVASGFTTLIHHNGHGFPLDYKGVWSNRAYWSNLE